MPSSPVTQYFAFYTESIGNRAERKTFADKDDLLDFVRLANDPESTIRGLIVIWGNELEFEPYEKVMTWRVKSGRQDRPRPSVWQPRATITEG